MKQSSNAIIIHNKKILLLLRDDKPDIPEPNKWSTIGGGVETGEDFDQALEREIFEETNLKIKDVNKFWTIPLGDTLHAIYLAKPTDEELKGLKLGEEGQKLQFFSYQELSQIPLTVHIDMFVRNFGETVRKIIEEEKIPSLKSLGLEQA